MEKERHWSWSWSGGNRNRIDPERKPWISKLKTEMVRLFVLLYIQVICHSPAPDKHFICREECYLDMSYADALPPEKIAFIAYNIGVYESVQKFGHLITSGKITGGTDVPKVAELLSETPSFYDAEMISGLMNAMLSHNAKSTISERVTAEQVTYVMNQLKATGVALP